MAKRAWLVILPLGLGVDPIGFPYDARPLTQGRLLGEVDDFWRSIDRNEPPQPDFERDAAAVVAARRALIGGEGLLPAPFVTPDPHMAAKLARHKELGADIRAMEGERKALSAEILPAMGDHKVMLAGDMKASLALIGDKTIERYVRKGYPRLTIGKAPSRRF